MTIFYAYGVDFRAGKSSQMVDVPSHQRDCLELMFAAAHGATELL
jgi:hypothetical protein